MSQEVPGEEEMNLQIQTNINTNGFVFANKIKHARDDIARTQMPSLQYKTSQ